MTNDQKRDILGRHLAEPHMARERIGNPEAKLLLSVVIIKTMPQGDGVTLDVSSDGYAISELSNGKATKTVAMSAETWHDMMRTAFMLTMQAKAEMQQENVIEPEDGEDYGPIQ